MGLASLAQLCNLNPKSEKENLKTFPTKEGFLSRLDRAKHRLFPGGGTADNYRLLTGLLDLLESRLSGEASQRVEACVASATP